MNTKTTRPDDFTLMSETMKVWLCVVAIVTAAFGGIVVQNNDGAFIAGAFGGAFFGLAVVTPVVFWIGALAANTTLAFGKRTLAGFLAAWVLWGIPVAGFTTWNLLAG